MFIENSFYKFLIKTHKGLENDDSMILLYIIVVVGFLAQILIWGMNIYVYVCVYVCVYLSMQVLYVSFFFSLSLCSEHALDVYTCMCIWNSHAFAYIHLFSNEKNSNFLFASSIWNISFENCVQIFVIYTICTIQKSGIPQRDVMSFQSHVLDWISILHA